MSSTPKKSLHEQAIELEGARRQARRHWDAVERPPYEPLKALTPRELFARPRPEWRIAQLLPDGALAELVGDSESLKSFIAIHMGLAVASGRVDFFNYKVKQGAVLYIAAEGAGAFQFRLRAWAHHHNVDIREVPFRTIAAPVNLRDSGFQDELRQIVAEVKPALIVVDTLHRCITSGNAVAKTHGLYAQRIEEALIAERNAFLAQSLTDDGGEGEVPARRRSLHE
jgi:hypothetical protein